MATWTGGAEWGGGGGAPPQRRPPPPCDALVAPGGVAVRGWAARSPPPRAGPRGGRPSGPPAGGLSLWVRLPGGADAAGFASRALRHGVSVAPGPFASPTGGHEHLRLCHDRPDEEITEGIARLAAAWSESTPTLVIA